MAFDETTPLRLNSPNYRSQFLRSRISRTLLSWPLLILPPLFEQPEPVSILTRWCIAIGHHGLSLFSAVQPVGQRLARHEAGGRSFRRVEAKARARASAARLLAAGPPRILRRLRYEVFPPGCFIRTPWPDGDVLSWQWFSVKIVSEGLAAGR